MRKILFIFLLLFTLFASIQAQTSQPNADTVMVMPFENISGKPEFNWVGESFADSISDLLISSEVRSSGLNVIPNEGRKIIQQRLKIPLTALPSLATSLKLAREGKATILIYGTYNIIPAQGEIAAVLKVKARIIKVLEGKLVMENLPDGSKVMREIALDDALADLQTIEAKVLVESLRKLNRDITIVENDVIKLSNKVPPRAFEAYIKGLLTPDEDVQKREAYFKNSMRLYAEGKSTESGDDVNKIYADAALELGHLFLKQGQNPNAIDYFGQVIKAVAKCNDEAKKDNKRLQCYDEKAAESAFYMGLIYWKQKDYETAVAALIPLAEDFKFISVYNTIGAISVEASRAEKKNEPKSAKFLMDGIDYLKKASESESDETASRFNYGVALILNNNFAEAARQLSEVIKLNQRDGEAYFLLAKAYEKIGDTLKATDANDKAIRFLTENNRYAQLEVDWKNTKIDGINLRVEQPPRKDFVSVILVKNQNTTVQQMPIDETEALLNEARTFYTAGRDEDAMGVLRRILSRDPTSAQAYLLLGKLHLRRADMELAIGSLKTSLFYDTSLIDAHIALTKIFLEKKDCQQAQSYIVSALTLDENNQEALSLQRQVERCGK